MKKIIVILLILSLVALIIKFSFFNNYEIDTNMKIEIKRKIFTDKSTIGEMFINGKFFCYTLEDKVREVKIQGETAIPKGTYDTIIDMSTRFKKLMPHILNVPNFSGIRIHAGNTNKDTEGCILLGSHYTTDFVSNSVSTYNSFMQLLNGFYKEFPKGKITLTVKNA